MNNTVEEPFVGKKKGGGLNLQNDGPNISSRN